MGGSVSCVKWGTRARQKVFVCSQQRGANIHAAARKSPMRAKLKTTIRRTTRHLRGAISFNLDDDIFECTLLLLLVLDGVVNVFLGYRIRRSCGLQL